MAIIDLTHPLEPRMPVYPGDEPPRFSAVANLDTHGYSAGQFTLTTHTGTHIDAPAHCLPGGKTLDQFPASHFLGPARVLDCRQIRDTITAAHLAPLGDPLEADFLLLLTGWDRFWRTERYFTGFPVLSSQAVTWLASHPIKGIGIDAPSLDGPEAKDLPNHRQLLSHAIVIIENLTRLDAIPGRRCQLQCHPLLITAADAAPARVIACC